MTRPDAGRIRGADPADSVSREAIRAVLLRPELTPHPGFLYAGQVPTAAKEVVFQMTESCVTATTATRLAA
jgi:hypothetical protein